MKNKIWNAILKILLPTLGFLIAIVIILGISISSVSQFLEQRPISAYQSGAKFFNIQSYHDATKKFKTAIFLDKYIVFWNDNSQLPIYYRELGRSLMKESDYSVKNNRQ